MRKFIATAALAAAVVLSGSGTALAHGYGDEGDGTNVVTVVDHTVVVCEDFSICTGDNG
ncbi:hypothetical protein [Streptomyces showdoensis]|uniref:hypothetical protein n=1 Tax=Streptomyces showdoensis TaxID=68268 RepID=UPI0010F05F4E|nr:hypothetical protein [Streptomyces showdoensis]